MSFDLTPVDYINWLIANDGLSEEEAKTQVEEAYFKQTGKRIKMVLRPFQGQLVWDYE